MKILHVTDYSMIGGIETYLKNISLVQSQDNIVTVISLNEKNKYLKEKTYEYLTLNEKNNFEKIVFLKQKISKDKYDIIFIHSLKSKIIFSFLKIFFKDMRLIYIEHGVYYGRRKYLSKIKRIIFSIIYKQPNKIICVQQNVKKSLIENFKNLEKKLFVVENGINLKKFKYSYCNEKKKEINIITTARLVEEKGIQTLIEAISLLKTNEKFKLFVIGDGPYLAFLKKKVEQFSLQNKVVFLGEIFEVEKCLAKGSFYIQPSKIEGFGLALLEAMAIGLPVIISNIEAFKKLIPLQQYIGFFEVDNSKELAQKIDILMKMDKKKLQKISEKMNFLAQNYSIEKTVKKLIDISLDNDINEKNFK